MHEADDAAHADAGLTGIGAAADEPELWRRWRERRDSEAREALLERHLAHAKIIAAIAYRQRVHDAVEFADYEQFARVGLLESFERYDPAQGAQFRTFAARRMRGAILDGLALLTERQSQLNARRRILAERMRSVADPTKENETSGGGPDGDGSTVSRPAELFQYLAEIGMGLAVGFMLEGTGMLDAGHGPSGEPDPPYRAIELRHTRQRLLSMVEQLPPQERIVVRNHYLQGLPFDEIAHSMQLTKGRISQIHKKALGTLRALMTERGACDCSI